MTKTAADYPNNYYASYDTKATQPTIVNGWYNISEMSSLDSVPDAADMIPVTEDQWNDPTFRLPIGKGVNKGVIVDYTAPAYVPPLADQATSALTAARAYVQNNFIYLGEAPTQDWIDYQKALIAISNGTDTKSTTLPTAPSGAA